MNKSELVRAVSRKTNQPQWLVDQVLDGLTEVVSMNLRAGDDVTVRSFGKFVLRHRRAVRRVNPRTNVATDVPDRVTAAFIPSPKLRERLNA